MHCAGEAPRLLAFDDTVGCPVENALPALEWTAAVGIVLDDDLLHASRLTSETAAAVVERRDGERRLLQAQLTFCGRNYDFLKRRILAARRGGTQQGGGYCQANCDALRIAYSFWNRRPFSSSGI